MSEKRDKRIIRVLEATFNVKLYEYQKEIIRAIFNNHRKITIKATTRAGKSWTVALATLFFALTHRRKKCMIIATTQHKTKIIYSYIADFLSMQPELVEMLDMDIPKNDIGRLKKETSKQKITFKNGSSIEVLTADIPSGGQGLMGHAGQFVVCDECAEYTPEVWTKVYRMLVDNPETQLIEIYNPWFLNHTYEHWNDDSWHKIHIDWKKCVEQGRMSIEDVEDQRKNITELEFEVLFNANFPEDIENNIFKSDYLKNAVTTKPIPDGVIYRIGVDVAASGKDYSVVTILAEKDNEFYFVDFRKYDLPDVMQLVGHVSEIADRYSKPIITIDSVGMGKGVVDRLRELGYNAYPYIAGNSALEKKRFFNRKSEDLFGAADIMKQGRFWNLPVRSPYTLELKKYIFEIRSDRLIKSIDPEDKSPDYADSLLYALSKERGRMLTFDLKTL